MTLRLRSWATPLTIGAFGIMAITGVLIFFHLDSGLNKPLHEWAGWLMVVGGVAHLVQNIRPAQLYLRRPVALGLMGGAGVILLLSFLPAPSETPGSGLRALMGAVAQAPVASVAALAGADPAAAMARLRAAGFVVEPDQTIGTLSGGDRGRQDAILLALFSEK